MENIAKKVVEKIKESQICPESKWKLCWKNYIFWALMVLMVIFGGIFFSLMIFNLFDVDIDVFRYFGIMRFVRLVVMTAPILWILLSLFALTFGILAFRKTTRGYRHSTLFVTSLIVLTISILGAAVHFFKMNERMGQEFGKRFPKFQEFSGSKEGHWTRPEDGLLMGEISELQSGNFMLKTPRNENWKVEYSDETKIKKDFQLENGARVGIVGEKIGDFVMKALAIRDFPDKEKDPVEGDRLHPPFGGPGPGPMMNDDGIEGRE